MVAPESAAGRDDFVPGGRAARLGTALAGLAQELASARREVAVLKRENATLRARQGSGERDLTPAGGRQRTATRRTTSEDC